tara:strand:+ start:1340 stop:1768 length:429 start_codon:yes stop_codon:yes gene_type:complete
MNQAVDLSNEGWHNLDSNPTFARQSFSRAHDLAMDYATNLAHCTSSTSLTRSKIEETQDWIYEIRADIDCGYVSSALARERLKLNEYIDDREIDGILNRAAHDVIREANSVLIQTDCEDKSNIIQWARDLKSWGADVREATE